MKSISEDEAEGLSRLSFPEYRGKLPINRGRVGFEGAPDDAQVMDEPLFRQLRGGFGESADYAYEVAEPNVICTEDTDDFVWPTNADEAARLWVVVIDYHF